MDGEGPAIEYTELDLRGKGQCKSRISQGTSQSCTNDRSRHRHCSHPTGCRKWGIIQVRKAASAS
jgi:hypothetical protein